MEDREQAQVLCKIKKKQNVGLWIEEKKAQQHSFRISKGLYKDKDKGLQTCSHERRNRVKSKSMDQNNNVESSYRNMKMWHTVSAFIGSIFLSFCRWPLELGSKTLPMKLYTWAKSGVTAYFTEQVL